MAIDMVCGKIVDEDSATASTIYKGNVYHFCANYCRDVFNKEPEEFINDVKEGEKTTDPVCGMQIDFSDAAGRSLHKGRFIYFRGEWRFGLLEHHKTGSLVGYGNRNGQLAAIEEGLEKVLAGGHIAESKGLNVLVV